MKSVSVVGTRPQFIKLAPLVQAVNKHNKSHSEYKIEHIIIHTGQHYDYEMNKIFFDELQIPEPNYNLGVGSGSHGWQTGDMIKKVEKILIREKPDWVIVYGDTNSTLAGALAATKLHIPVAHIEAGLRSYNKRMPEEINRVLTDHCSNILFCPTENSVKNLKKEGFTNIINDGKLATFSTELPITNNKLPIVINVGDIMYDALLMCLPIAKKKSNILASLKLKPREYYLATVHRAKNTDNRENLRNIFEALIEIGKNKPVIIPLHPRTRIALESAPFLIHNPNKSIRTIDPVSYFDMLILEKNAKKILTDSGGIQKEAYLLKVPCITLRNETEWVEIVEIGWNKVTGNKEKNIVEETVKTYSEDRNNKKWVDLYGGGKASARIVDILRSYGG